MKKTKLILSTIMITALLSFGTASTSLAGPCPPGGPAQGTHPCYF